MNSPGTCAPGLLPAPTDILQADEEGRLVVTTVPETRETAYRQAGCALDEEVTVLARRAAGIPVDIDRNGLHHSCSLLQERGRNGVARP
jgi:hypothetical protein